MDAFEADLVERIYAAALLPELWPDAIDRMAHRLAARGGSIFTLSEGRLSWNAPSGTKPIMEAYIAGGWASRNTRLERLLAHPHAGFLRDSELVEGDYESLPIVREFLRPHDIYYTAATVVAGAKGDLAVFSVDRGQAAGPYTSGEMAWLDRLRPHLARSIALTTRLQMRQASAAAAALSMVGIPAAILAENGTLRATNRLFDALAGKGFAYGASGSLICLDRRADGLLRQVLSTRAQHRLSVRSIPFVGQDDSVAVMHLIPACGEAADLLGANGTLLVIAQPRDGIAVSLECLKWLYDLTATEAHVASRLCAGRSVEEIAVESKTSLNTVRTHVKAVLRKAGVTRQADFLLAVGSLFAIEQSPTR